MSLNSVPNEIVHKIIRFLDKDSLVAVSLTCQHLHENVEPFLYESITQTGCAAFPNLVRTMLAKPHLAKLVTKFSARTIDESFGESLDISFLTEEHLNQIQASAENIGYLGNDGSFWISAIKDSEESRKPGNSQYDAVFALCVLLFAETLEFFEMVCFNIHYFWTERLLNRMATLQKSQENRACLANLREITVIYSEDNDYSMHVGDSASSMPLFKILPFLKLPSLKKFTMEKVHAERYPEDYLDENYNIVDLTIDGNFDTTSMKAFLRCFPLLRKFKFTQCEEDFGDPVLRTNTFCEGLSRLKDTLEEFEFYNSGGLQTSSSDDSDIDGVWEEPLPNYKDFKALKVYRWQYHNFHKNPQFHEKVTT